MGRGQANGAGGVRRNKDLLQRRAPFVEHPRCGILPVPLFVPPFARLHPGAHCMAMIASTSSSGSMKGSPSTSTKSESMVPLKRKGGVISSVTGRPLL